MHKIQTGQVFLAHPLLEDSQFQRSVILLVDHDDQGTMGFVLNETTALHLTDALQGEWPKLPLFIGGPVGQDTLFYLHKRPDLIPDSVEIGTDLYWGGDFASMKTALQNQHILAHEIRFFVGYAGWSADQLKQELDEGSWAILPHHTTDFFAQPQELYAHLLRHLPEKIRMWSHAPRRAFLN